MEIEFDTTFDPDYPLYTRANAGEVFPEIFGPLAWSLLGRGIDQGFLQSFRDHFHVLGQPDRDWFTIGRFAGRVHLNLSVIRTVAERLPGISAESNDAQFFGEVAARGLPAHERSPYDPTWRRKGLPATLRTTALATRWVRRSSAQVRQAADENVRFLIAGPTDLALIERLAQLRERYTDLFGLHMTVRALTSAPATLAAKALERKGYGSGEALEIVSSVPDLESAKPSRALAGIARTLDPGSPLAKLIEARTTPDELRASSVEGAPQLADRVDEFLARYGHRGVNEFDPTVPAWEQEPDRVLALVRSLVTEQPDSPRGATREPPRHRLDPVTAGLVHSARRAVARGEVSKNNLILFTHQLRKLVFELSGRWRDRFTHEQLTLLTLDEIVDIARGDPPPDEAMQRRRAEIEPARTVEPAVWSQGSLSVHEIPPATGAAEISGVGGSAGSARGRVRLCSDPYGDFDDGDILVAKITDTAWTPLFLAAGAVVTEIGGMLSHATIVARELGIPAVVDTKTATTELADGDVVEVDGGTGIVRVLERRG